MHFLAVYRLRWYLVWLTAAAHWCLRVCEWCVGVIRTGTDRISFNAPHLRSRPPLAFRPRTHRRVTLTGCSCGPIPLSHHDGTWIRGERFAAARWRRQRRYASTHKLVVPRFMHTLHCTSSVTGRALTVAVACLWNGLPHSPDNVSCSHSFAWLRMKSLRTDNCHFLIH